MIWARQRRRAACSTAITVIESLISPRSTIARTSSKGSTRRSMNSVWSGGREAGGSSVGHVEVRDLAQDALRRVEVAELDEATGLDARLLGELSLGGLLERLARVLAARRDLPVEVAGDVAILADEEHVVAVEEGQHAHAFGALDDAVEGGLPARAARRCPRGP